MDGYELEVRVRVVCGVQGCVSIFEGPNVAPNFPPEQWPTIARALAVNGASVAGWFIDLAPDGTSVWPPGVCPNCQWQVPPDLRSPGSRTKATGA